jgi:hypothetical protein
MYRGKAYALCNVRIGTNRQRMGAANGLEYQPPAGSIGSLASLSEVTGFDARGTADQDHGAARDPRAASRALRRSSMAPAGVIRLAPCLTSSSSSVPADCGADNVCPS